MKNILQILISSVLSLLLGSMALAQEAKTVFLAETRLQQNTSCDRADLSRELIELDIESAAFQKCQSSPAEMMLTKEMDVFNRVQVCKEGQGGETVYQRLYSCQVRANPNAIFEGSTSMLQSDQDSRSFGLIYFGESCVRFRVTGMTSTAERPVDQLRELASSLVVTENETTRAPQVLNGAEGLYIQYAVTGRMRSSQLKIQNLQAGQSLNDLIEKKLGVNPNTGFKYSVQIQGTCR